MVSLPEGWWPIPNRVGTPDYFSRFTDYDKYTVRVGEIYFQDRLVLRERIPSNQAPIDWAYDRYQKHMEGKIPGFLDVTPTLDLLIQRLGEL